MFVDCVCANLTFLLSNKPNLVIANTIKGKGISYLENKLESHYSVLDEKQYKIALKEL